MLLTTEAALVDIPAKTSAPAMPDMSGMGGMGGRNYGRMKFGNHKPKEEKRRVLFNSPLLFSSLF